MIIEKHKANSEREICLCGLPIVQYGTKNSNGIKETYLSFFPISFEQKAINAIIDVVGNSYDYIFFARAGIGETYLLIYLIDEICKKNNIKNPCFVSIKSFYKDIFKIFYPNINFYSLDKKYEKYINSINKHILKNKNIIININPSTLSNTRKLFFQYEEKKLSKHYVDVILEFNEMENFTYKTPVFEDDIEKKVKQKLKKENFDNLVLLVPETNFIKKLENSFWYEIKNALEAKGYSTFINNESISLCEAYYLANKAKGIIALRGGFSEFISTVKCPKHIIYNHCQFHYIPNIQELLTLKKYPFVKQESLFEYNALFTDLNLIKNEILRNF